MKALIRTLCISTVLAALVSVLVTQLLLLVSAKNDSLQLRAMCGLFLLPPFAVWLTIKAVSSLPQNWFLRAVFWAVAGAGWLATSLAAQGRYESNPEYLAIFYSAVGLIVLSAAWLMAKARRFPTLRGMGEAMTGAAILAVVCVAWTWHYDVRTQAIAAQAEARWAEIGLPIAEFEKTLAAGQENAGSEVFREILRDELDSRFYKEGTAAADREPVIEPSKASEESMKRAMSIVCAKVPPSDEFDLTPRSVEPRIKRTSAARGESPETGLPAQSLTADEPMAPALDADFRRILAAEPPAWAFDLHDGYAISVPSFLGIRKFTQLAEAESLRCFAAGDAEGASRAIDAGLRVGQSLRANPTLVSLMIYVAVDATLAPQRVRLPATEDGLPSIARDAVALRTELLKRAQVEGWGALRFADRIMEDQKGEAAVDFLPQWVGRIACRHVVRRLFALAALSDVEHAAILQAPATLHLPDLGASLHEAISAKYPNAKGVNWLCAAMRIETTLLLREQSELIRDARARLAAGRPVESRDSVVLPGVRWELTADAEKDAVATRLVGVPRWIVANEVTSDAFWLLPLDGSVAWQFYQPAPTASR